MSTSIHRRVYTSYCLGSISSGNPLQWTWPNFGWTSRHAQDVWWVPKPFYWTLIAADVHVSVAECEQCCRHRPPQKHQKWVLLFSPMGPLVFVAINILGPLTKTRLDSRFIIAMRNWNRKLPRTIACAKRTTPIVATGFSGLEHWIFQMKTQTRYQRTIVPNLCTRFCSAVRLIANQAGQDNLVPPTNEWSSGRVR